MKTNVTYVDAAKFEALILAASAKHGFGVVPQKGFIQVAGPRGRRLYVASTKRVGRVDISGFVMEGPGYVKPHCGEFGNVKQQLDFSLAEDAVLLNFEALLDHMATLAPVEKAERKPAAAKADAPKGWQKVPTAPAKADRKALIAKKAAASSKPADDASGPTA
jgi:hypothetical protein